VIKDKVFAWHILAHGWHKISGAPKRDAGKDVAGKKHSSRREGEFVVSLFA